ncbi:hypothetical protein BCR44DRAFT_1021036 [Catenaria anguillulae PL171]|uniref:Uncharacterized protein n=1 Tax=Catenaria anguillulae PL171 TaxID=765915 RepID=A0A1Y2H816_9FUNG|nr:hypothetical protein BCR44DRAFT_1021036 [Catenaria anguillulae PL171]
MVPRPINASPVYWPVQFASPQRGVSLGFDFYYGPRTLAVDRVLRTGEPVLSDVVYLYMPLEDPETLQPGMVLFTKPVVRSEDNSTWMVSATVNLVPYLSGTLGKSAPAARIYAKVEIGGVPVYETERVQPGVGIAARAPYVKSAVIGQQNITMVCLPTAFLVGMFVTGWSIAAPLLTVFGGAGLAWMIATLVDRLQRLRTAESLLLSWRSYSEAILQATPNPMILVNDQGNIAGVNEPLLELTGHTTDSIKLVTKLCDLIVPLRKDPDEELFSALSVVGGGSRAGTGRAADDASLPVRATVASYSAGSAWRQNQQQQQQQQQSQPAPPDSTSIQIAPDDDETNANADTTDLQAIHDLLLAPGRREVLVVPAPALTSDPADLDAASTIDAMVTVSEPTGNPVIQHVLVLTDLREQRARDRQLAELLRETELLNAQQRQLLLYLAHELRNPVYVIQGSVQAAADAAAEQVEKNGIDGAGTMTSGEQHLRSSAAVSFAATEASDRAGVLAATEHVTTLLDAVVEYVEASSAAMAVFPYTSPGSRGAGIVGRVGVGAGGTLVRPSEAIAAATLTRSTYGRAASALRAGHASGSSPKQPRSVPRPLPADARLSSPHRMVSPTTLIPAAAASAASIVRPAAIGLSDALSLADVISPATALALNPDWTHLDIGCSFNSLPVSALTPRTPDFIRRPPCVQLSRASRHALHKLSAVCRAAPGVTLAGWSVTLPHPPRLPPPLPGAAAPLVLESETYVTLCAALALPDSIGHADLTTLSSPFDWSISGQGSEFRLFGLQVAILTRLAELAGGMAKVDQANREIVLQVPARPCSWVAQGLPCEGVRATGEIGLMEVSGLGASSSHIGQPVKVSKAQQPQLQRPGIIAGGVRARPATPPSTPSPEAAAGKNEHTATLPTVTSVSTVTDHRDDVELQPLLPSTLQTCDSAATVIVDQADPSTDSKAAKSDIQAPPMSPVLPTLVSVSPVPAPDHHECPSEASSAPASPLVVLLVEDNALIQALTKRFLERDGFHVVVADHGQAALDLLADPDLSSRVHLVVMDLMMPVLDGIDATRIIRQTRSPAELPIVALTANAMAEERERCLQSGFNAFLTKPVTRQKLIETVRSLWSASPSPVATTIAPVQA